MMTNLGQLLDKDVDVDEDLMNNLDVVMSIDVQVDDSYVQEDDTYYNNYDETLTYM